MYIFVSSDIWGRFQAESPIGPYWIKVAIVVYILAAKKPLEGPPNANISQIEDIIGRSPVRALTSRLQSL